MNGDGRKEPGGVEGGEVDVASEREREREREVFDWKMRMKKPKKTILLSPSFLPRLKQNEAFSYPVAEPIPRRMSGRM